MQIKNCLTAFVVTACAAVGIKGNPTQFSRRSGLTDSVYINGEWSKMTDQGCDPKRAGVRVWSATLDGAAGDVDSACLNTNATVSHVFFQSPSECEVSLEKVATGYFDTMDTLCGIPPCPNDYAWDYRSKMCISCQTGVAPPKVAGGDTQLRREILAEASERYEADTLQKRVNCPTLGAFNIPGQRVILRLRNRVEAWTVGQEEGPTAAQLVANPNVQAAFQATWAASYPGPNQMREMGGWIYMNPANGDIYVRRLTTAGEMGRVTPLNSRERLSIILAHPEHEVQNPARAGYLMVATFHTHPTANPEPGNPALPSRGVGDNYQEWTRGLPGIIIHDRGLTAYGPRARAQMGADGLPDFPQANFPGAIDHEDERGSPVGNWVPSRVANQPPQSNPSPSASGFCWGCTHATDLKG